MTPSGFDILRAARALGDPRLDGLTTGTIHFSRFAMDEICEWLKNNPSPSDGYFYPPIPEESLKNCHGYEVDRAVVTENGKVYVRMLDHSWKALT